MSDFKVPLTQIKEVQAHPNADKLEVAVVYGFQVIVGKGMYQPGDKVIYVPIDSVLSQELEDQIFPPGSKVDRRSAKRRIKQIRLRKVASQGLILGSKELVQYLGPIDNFDLEDDLSVILGITKYEPPEPTINVNFGGKKKRDKKGNPLFHKYNGLENIKWYPEKFKSDEIVVLQEKIHGMNARAAIMPFVANTLWKKLKKLLRLAPEFEFCYGSNNVQIQDRITYTGYYGEDIHGKVFQQLDVKNKLKNGESIYGEIYGYGIQKGYSYGCKEGEYKFVLFDVKILQADGTQKWLSPDEVLNFAVDRGFDIVPEIYRGEYQSLAFVKEFTIGDSVLNPSQKIREGVVVKAVDNYDEFGNKRALKVVSEVYLDGEQSDFH